MLDCNDRDITENTLQVGFDITELLRAHGLIRYHFVMRSDYGIDAPQVLKREL